MKSSSPLVGVVLGLLILSLLFLGIERGLGRRRGKPHFRRGWLLDVGYFFLTPLVTKAIVRLALIVPLGVLVGLGLAEVEGLRTREFSGFGPLSRQPLWLQIVEI